MLRNEKRNGSRMNSYIGNKSIPPLISRNVDDINLRSIITVSHKATLKLAKTWMYKQDWTCRMSGASIKISHWSIKYSLNQQIACFLLIFCFASLMKIELPSRDLENKWLFYSVRVVLHWNKHKWNLFAFQESMTKYPFEVWKHIKTEMFRF